MMKYNFIFVILLFVCFPIKESIGCPKWVPWTLGGKSQIKLTINVENPTLDCIQKDPCFKQTECGKYGECIITQLPFRVG